MPNEMPIEVTDEKAEKMTSTEKRAYFGQLKRNDDGVALLPKICFDRYFDDYKTQANAVSYIEKFVNEEAETRHSYVGREVLEMIQNADDQGSSYIAVYVNTKNCEISFVNGGKPFRYAGFDAIMVGGTSPKSKDLSSIGNKGLGFRSTLNWGESIEIFSRKVHCTFSLDVAKRKWNELKEVLEEPAISDILQNAKNQALDEECPISVFSVPDYEPIDSFPEKYSELRDIATIIKIHYKANKKNDVLAQLNSLPANTLVFLRNIKNIFIDIDGKRTTFESLFNKKRSLNKGFVENCSIKKDGECEEWIVYKEDGAYTGDTSWVDKASQAPKLYQIGFAVKEKDKEIYPLHVFFKTEETVGLPCLAHGTFFLTPDRKRLLINAYNTWLQEEMADRLLCFAEFIASEQVAKKVVDCWSYNMLQFTKDTPSLKEFRSKIEKGREAKKIYPTITEGYKSYIDTFFYGKNFASFLTNCPVTSDAGLGNHLIEATEFENFVRKPVFDIASKLKKASHLINEIEKKSPAENLPEYRCDFIAAIINAKIEGIKIDVLIDENRNILDSSASQNAPIVNTGNELQDPPEFLNIRYVSKTLVDQLKKKVPHDITINQDHTRAITTQMQTFTNVTYGDISGIKKRVCSAIKGCSLENFKSLIKCLYETSLVYEQKEETERESKKFSFKKNESGSEGENAGANDVGLTLLNCAASYSNANELILFDKSFPDGLENVVPSESKKHIKDYVLWGNFDAWKEILEVDDAAEIQHFFTDVLGVSLYVPIKFEKSVWEEDGYYNYLNKPENSNPDKLKKHSWYKKSASDNLKNHSSYWTDSIFVDTLLTNDASLENVLTAVIKNDDIFNSLLKTKWSFKCDKPIERGDTKVCCSYVAYRMIVFDSNPSFKFKNNIKKSICDEIRKYFLGTESANTLIKNIKENTGRGEEDIKLILLQLGIKNEENLTLLDLYRRIRSLAVSFSENPKISVQSKYYNYRKRVLKYQSDHKSENINSNDQLRINSIKENYKLVAVCNGKRDVFDVKEVYYWDNKKLPQHILENLPKLDIGNRVGEKSVSEVFGVKTLDGILFAIDRSDANKPVENETLQIELAEYIKDRWQYILAAVCNGDARGQLHTYAESLKGFYKKLSIVENCIYSMDDGTKKEENIKMALGDLLIVDSQYYICYDGKEVESAIRIPEFLESVVEALCTELKLSEDVWYDRFWKILSQSTPLNDYDYEKYDDPDFKIQIGKELGISQNDLNFWENVAQQKGITLDNKQAFCVGIVRLKYIQEVFRIDLSSEYSCMLPEIDDMTGVQQYSLMKKLELQDVKILGSFNEIPDYYNSYLTRLLEEYLNKYNHLLHSEIEAIDDKATRLDRAKNYLSESNKFKNLSYDEIVERHREEIVDVAILENEFKALVVQNSYDLNKILEIAPEVYRILDGYSAILEKHRFTSTDSKINENLKSMMLFTGFEEELERELNAIESSSTDDVPKGTQEDLETKESKSPKESDDGDGDDDGIKEVGDDGWELVPPSPKKPKGSKGKKKPKKGPGKSNTSLDSFASDLDKEKAGKEAEITAYNELLKYSEKYKIVHIYSKNLNASGENSEHYDLSYIRLDEPKITRCLEIKSMSSSSILMSDGEFKYAKEHKDIYDLAIVKDHKVTIIRSPFAKQEIEGEPETYKITLKLK